MRKASYYRMAMICVACAPFIIPSRTSANPQDVPVTLSAAHDLSDLQLGETLRAELEGALARRDYKRAETILVDEAELDPKSARTAKLLVTAAGIFFLDGQYLNAAIAWKRAEAITPLDERSRFTLAMAYVKLNRRDWARSELEKLAAAEPRNSLYAYWLGRLDYDGRNYASAISRLQKVIELDPKMMRAYDVLGLCYDYMGKLDEAIKSYNEAIELNRLQSKPSPWPHVDLAISLISLNRLAEAERNLAEAIRFDPKLPQAHYELGRVLEMQGRHEEAVAALDHAVTLDSSYPEPHYLLGRIYHRLGNDPVSKSEIAQFQELKRAREAQSAPTASRP